MFKLLISLLFISLLTFSSSAHADQVDVVRVVDGDTLLVNNAGKHTYLRLACIDSAEIPHTNKDKLTLDADRRDQFLWGEISKAALSSMVQDKIDIKIIDIDVYGRLVVDITLPNGKNLQEELLRMGVTEIYPKYFKNCPNGVDKMMAQKEAHDANIGIWSDKIYVVPWIFRLHKNVTYE